MLLQKLFQVIVTEEAASLKHGIPSNFPFAIKEAKYAFRIAKIYLTYIYTEHLRKLLEVICKKIFDSELSL